MSEELAPMDQPSLFCEIELDLLTVDEPKTRKRYTAASLERCLAKRDAIVRALAEGHGLLRIARAFGVSHHLVSSLRDQRPELVAIEKKQLSGQIGRILKLSADKFEEALESGTVPAGQIPVAFGIFSDKKAMLDGDAGLVIEHRHRIEASVDGFVARLKSAATAVESKSIGNAENCQQKGADVDVGDGGDTLMRGDQAVPRPGPAGADGGGGDAPAGAGAFDPMDRSEGGAAQKDTL